MMPVDLALRLKLDRRPRSWRGDCPCCGYPRAFSLRAGTGQRPLLFCANGCDRHALSAAVARAAGQSWKAPECGAGPDELGAAARRRRTACALGIWADARPAFDTLGDAYLADRRLAGLSASRALRFHPATPHPEGGRLPALIAAVLDATGIIVGIHRTYLDPATGRKAAAEPAKASLGPVWGGAVRLDPEAEELTVGEGIESAASAGRVFRLPAWAALSAGNLGRGLVLPRDIRSIVIAADPDEAGQRAAREAEQRWRMEGRRVRVATPDDPKADFNDLLAQRRGAMEVPHGLG